MRLKPPVFARGGVFSFLIGGLAFWLINRCVRGFKRFVACLLFYLGSLFLFAVSLFVFEVAWVRDGWVETGSP